jgi:hypothetical protein
MPKPVSVISPTHECADLMETSLEFRESPPVTALVVRRLPVAAAFVIAVAIAMIAVVRLPVAEAFVIAVAIATIAVVSATTAPHPVAVVMVTVTAVPPAAADSFHAPIATVGLFYPTSSVQLASGSAMWLNTATCWPPPFASNGT